MMNTTNIDELINQRAEARASKNFALSDQIRNHLDSKRVFVFDYSWGQEVYHLQESYFEFLHRIETLKGVKFQTEREFVEFKIKDDIQSEKKFEAWLYTMKHKK